MLKELFGLKNNTLRCNGDFQSEMLHHNIKIVGIDGEVYDEIPKYVKIDFKEFDNSKFVTYTIYYDLLDLKNAFEQLPPTLDISQFEFDGSNIILSKVSNRAKHKKAPELSDVELQIRATLCVHTNSDVDWQTQEIFPLRFKSSSSYVRLSINLNELANIFLQQAQTSNGILNHFQVANVTLNNHDLSINLELMPYYRNVVVSSDTLTDCGAQVFKVPMPIKVIMDSTTNNELTLVAQPLHGQLLQLLADSDGGWVVPKGYKITSLSEPTFVAETDDCPSRVEYTFDASLFPNINAELLLQDVDVDDMPKDKLVHILQKHLLNNYPVPEHDDKYLKELVTSLNVMYGVTDNVINGDNNEINKF